MFKAVIAQASSAIPQVTTETIKNELTHPEYNPSFGGVFTTPMPETYPEEYIQPTDKQDEFDWKLSKVIFGFAP